VNALKIRGQRNRFEVGPLTQKSMIGSIRTSDQTLAAKIGRRVRTFAEKGDGNHLPTRKINPHTNMKGDRRKVKEQNSGATGAQR
jgi:hypothetical protein